MSTPRWCRRRWSLLACNSGMMSESRRGEPATCGLPFSFRRLLDLDEVVRGQRAEGQGCQSPADVERAQIDREEAGAFDELADLGLCGSVIARIKQYVPATRHVRIRQRRD